MVSVPHEVMTDFTDLLKIREVPQEQVDHYKKWLRYFYDFSAKYLHEQDQAIPSVPCSHCALNVTSM